MPAGRCAVGPACAPVRRDRAGVARRLLGPPGVARPVCQPRRRRFVSRPTRDNSAVTCSRRHSWWTATTVVVGSDRAAVEAAIAAAGALPDGLTLSRSQGGIAVEVTAAPRYGSRRAHRLRPTAGDRCRRRRERWPATARVPHRAGSRDAGRMGRHRPPTYRQATWSRARAGHSGAVVGPSGTQAR